MADRTNTSVSLELIATDNIDRGAELSRGDLNSPRSKVTTCPVPKAGDEELLGVPAWKLVVPPLVALAGAMMAAMVFGGAR